MRITLEKYEKSKPEPTREQIEPHIRHALKIFREQGLDETPLILKVSIPFGRILFDIKDSTLATWKNNGRPDDIYTGYAEARKGMLFLGTVGVGKTLAMKVVAGTIQGWYVPVPELSTAFSQKGSDGFWNMADKAGRWDLFLDDLGSEKDVKSYSNKLPIEDLIYRRYDMWQQHGVRTHITTNLTGEGLSERYGPRVTDRLKEMMEFVIETGKSLRK